MLGRLNHVAIAVKDAKQAAKIYGTAFNAEISDAVPLPEHGVITVFVTLPNTKIEFIEPLGDASPIAKFVERNADGGIHHVCYDVPDIIAARDRMIGEGARVLGDGVAEDRRARQAGAVLCIRRTFPGRSVEIEQN
jgi:methylmalonyl-CoA/ethylmalonyl-CoA epimerase